MDETIVCARIRERLQDLRDSGGVPDAATFRHLGVCPFCAGFRTFLESLGPALRAAAEAHAAAPWEPDYARVIEEGSMRRGRQRGQRLLRVVPAAAACLLVAALGFAVLLPPDPVEEATVAQNVEVFVDGLFRTPGPYGSVYALAVFMTDPEGD